MLPAPSTRHSAEDKYTLTLVDRQPIYHSRRLGGERLLEFGTTCTAVLVQGRDVAVANVGDSSAVLGRCVGGWGVLGGGAFGYDDLCLCVQCLCSVVLVGAVLLLLTQNQRAASPPLTRHRAREQRFGGDHPLSNHRPNATLLFPRTGLLALGKWMPPP